MANGEGVELQIRITATDEATPALENLRGVLAQVQEAVAGLREGADGVRTTLVAVGAAAGAIGSQAEAGAEGLAGMSEAMAELEAAARGVTEAASEAIRALQALGAQAHAAGYRAGTQYVQGMEQAIQDGLAGVEYSVERAVGSLGARAGQQLADDISRSMAQELEAQGVAL